MTDPDDNGAPFYVCTSRTLLPDELRQHVRDAELGREAVRSNAFPVNAILLRVLGRIEGDLDQWMHDGTLTLQLDCPPEVEPWQIETALSDLGITILAPVPCDDEEEEDDP